MSQNKVKIVFDTNSCRSDAGAYDHFFGYRNEISKLESSSEILIPDVVIQEITAQKRRALRKKRDEHLSNPFFVLSAYDPEAIKAVDIDGHIQKLIDNEGIKYTTLSIKDSSLALETILKWSIDKRPPFSGEEKTGDKGFKDACIAFMIEELLVDCEDEYIVFMTKDDLLKKKFENNPRVKIVSDFDAIANYVIDEFLNDYLIEKIESELSIENANIINSWINLGENWVVEIETEEGSTLVIIDSHAREILDTYENNLNFFIKMLTSSGSFEQTHNAVTEITAIQEFLSQKDVIEILGAASTNNQIYWIADDEDVKFLVAKLYESVQDLIDEDIARALRTFYGV